MDHKRNKDIEIVLALRDRRGHRIRAALCDGLRIKVWTHDPRRFLTYHLRDIFQDEEEDILRIPEFELDGLAPGVIVYRYSFYDHHAEREETVVTDIKWRGGYPEGRPPHRPMSPDHFHGMERLAELIEDLDRKLSNKVRGLYNYIQNEYPEEVKRETERATEAENEIIEEVKRVVKVLEDEVERAQGVEGALLDNLGALTDTLSNFLETYDSDKEAAGKDLESLRSALDNAKTAVKKELKRVDGNISDLNDAIERLSVKISGNAEDIQNLGIRISKNATAISENADAISTIKRKVKELLSSLDTEVARAKAMEDLLSTRIGDTNTRLNEESVRAKLVESDITNALLRLKQSVAEGKQVTDAEITSLRSELSEKIDYRIKEIVGAAPEALDTLEEIAARLKEDDDAIKVLNSILSEKVNVEDVYKRTAIDTFIQELKNLILQETQRAQLSESANAAAISVINGDENTIGSIRHALADAEHYTDDKIKEHERNNQDALKTILSDIDKRLDGKQEQGDYVGYTQDGARKHVILPNDCNVVGTTKDGTDGRNLIMLSKYDVVDIGSVNVPVNLNGKGKRPTYNDNLEIALLEDLKDIEAGTAEIEAVPVEEIRRWFQKE